LTGSVVYAPRPDGRWQVMTPGEAPHYQGTLAFDPATGQVSLRGEDGTTTPIRPEDYLGGLRGSGAYKTAFTLLDKTAVVYRDESPTYVDNEVAHDDPQEMITKTRQLEQMGAPHVAKIDGLIQINGHDTLLMDSYAAADRNTKTGFLFGNNVHQVDDVSYYSQRSVSSLQETRQWLVDNKVSIADMQFLIGKDGTFVLADFEAIKTGQGPSARNGKGKDRQVRTALA